jgi:hypothetical protein
MRDSALRSSLKSLVSSFRADGNTRNKSSPIRKPLEQYGDGNDKAEAYAGSTDDAVTDIQPPELMIRDAGQKHSESIRAGTESFGVR